VVFAATLLTTCGTDTAIGPGIPAQSSVDLAGLLRAGGPIPIPIDTVLVELRRLTDSSVAFSQQVDVARFQQQGNDLILSIALALRTTPEQFYLYAEARGGGVVYYTVRSTVTAAAGQSTQSPSLIPTYVGPGSTADSVVLTLVPSSVAPGDSALATAVVFDNDAPVAGAPVGIVPADTVTVRRREVGVNSVWLVAPATGSGSTPVTATTPTGLIAFGQFDWAASAPVSYVTVLPLAQSLAPTQTLQYSAIPYDALDNILTGLPVSWTSSNLAAATVSPTGLVTAVAVGSSTITATIGGAAGTSLLTVATAGSGPGSVVAASATSQGVTVNQLVAALPAVLVSDSASQPLAGVAVTFAVTAGGGSITGGTATTNAAGLATLGSWRAGQTAGANTVTATVTGLPPVAFTATGAPTAVLSLAKISGDAQSDTAGRTLPLPLVAEARDSFNNVVPAAVVTWTTTDGSLTPLVDTTDALGLTQASWTLGFAVPNPTATATLGTHTAVFNAATIFLTPSILLTWQNTPPGVGVGLAAQVRIQLTQPAPVGGVTINLVSANSSLFTVAQATRFIAAGQTVDSVAVNGIAVGTANLDATGSGYTAGALSVTVEDRSISVPVTLSIAYGITSPALPIQLATNAPAGGVTLNVVSSNPAAVGVQAPTVTIPAGQKTANVTLIGVLPGTATVSVSGAGYITANTAVTTAASLVGIPASITIDASFGTTLTVQFTSSGSAIAAPAPGVLVSLIPADSGCVAAVSPKLIPTGLATITSAISYGGSTTLPCSTQLILSAPNVTPDTVPVTVNPTPGITLYPATVGSGLQESIYGYLGATNHGGVNVTLTSSDPALLLLAPNATTAGTASISVPVANGQNYFPYYVQALEGVTGRATITATVAGFSNGVISDSVAVPGMDLINVPGSTTTLTPGNNIYARVGVPQGTSYLNSVQNVRFGGTALTATFTTSDTAVADLVKSGGGGGALSQTAVIPVGLYYTPTDTTSGGVLLRPRGTGSATISASIPGFVQITSAAGSGIAVAQPPITLYATTVGSGLQGSIYGYLGATNHGGVNVTLTSSDPALLLLAPNATTAGTASISVPVANGQNYFPYYVQALEGVTGRATITATVAGFSNGVISDSVAVPGLDLIGVPGTTTTLSGSNAIYARVGVPQGTSYLNSVQNVRFGGTALTVTFTSTVPTVADLVKSGPVFGGTQIVTIPVGLYYTPTDTAAGGIRVRPVLAGQTIVSASIPGFTQVASAAGSTLNITQPGMTLAGTTLGSGLEVGTYGYLGAPNHGGVTVTVRSSNPLVLVAPNASTVGDSLVTLFVADGQTYFPFSVQALEGQTGQVVLTASAPGFTNGTATADVVTPAFDVIGLQPTPTAGAADVSLYARIGYAVAGNSYLAAVQNVRPGATPLTVTFGSSNAAAVPLVVGGVTAPSQTAAISPGSYYTPTGGQAGNVLFRPLTQGTATITTTIPGFTPVLNGTTSYVVTVQ